MDLSARKFFQGKVIVLTVILAALSLSGGCRLSELCGCRNDRAETELVRKGLPDRVAANLWMSTSAEYEAVCRMTFGLAYEKIRARVEEGGTVIDGKPVAIISDLDGTIMDNSLFDAYLAIAGVPYSSELWERWEINHADDVGLVPGAGEFIEKVRARGVEVMYISNRAEKNREHTIRAMVHLGLIQSPAEVSGANRLKLQLADLTSSKESRRERVREKYHVIACLGDALGDFSADFDKKSARTLEERSRGVRAHREMWGKQWFILPNPVYGHWERPIDMKRAKYFLPRLEKL